MSYLEIWRGWASRIKRDGITLWFVYRHPNTPRWLRLLCMLIVAYALSPIDLIPDFIPILGYVDDLLLLPLLIALAVYFIPPAVMDDCRHSAAAWVEEHRTKPRSYLGAFAIVSIWALATYLCFIWIWPLLETIP